VKDHCWAGGETWQVVVLVAPPVTRRVLTKSCMFQLVGTAKVLRNQ
jgi:hypothetical protein